MVKACPLIAFKACFMPVVVNGDTREVVERKWQDAWDVTIACQSNGGCWLWKIVIKISIFIAIDCHFPDLVLKAVPSPQGLRPIPFYVHHDPLPQGLHPIFVCQSEHLFHG